MATPLSHVGTEGHSSTPRTRCDQDDNHVLKAEILKSFITCTCLESLLGFASGTRHTISTVALSIINIDSIIEDHRSQGSLIGLH